MHCTAPMYNIPIQKRRRQKRLLCLNIIAEIRGRQWCIWVERAVIMLLMMIAEWCVHSEARSVVWCERSVWNALRSAQRAQTLVRFKALATPPVQVGDSKRLATPSHWFLFWSSTSTSSQKPPRISRRLSGYQVMFEWARARRSSARTRTSLSVQFSTGRVAITVSILLNHSAPVCAWWLFT